MYKSFDIECMSWIYLLTQSVDTLFLYTRLPTKDETSETTVRNVFSLFSFILGSPQVLSVVDNPVLSSFLTNKQTNIKNYNQRLLSLNIYKDTKLQQIFKFQFSRHGLRCISYPWMPMFCVFLYKPRRCSFCIIPFLLRLIPTKPKQLEIF